MTMNAFRSGKATDFLITIKGALDRAHEDLRRFARPFGWSPPTFVMKLFTDNFLVACPLRDPGVDHGEPELGTMLILFAQMQTRLAVEGFFLRGAIDTGQHFQSGDIVYGDALL